MQAGIQLFGGLSGTADAAVADYLAGKLVFDRTSTAPTTTTTRATAAAPTAGAGATDRISKAALRADPECGFAI